MTRVDFYLLQQSGSREALLFCCRLIEKAWQRGHRILVNCASSEQRKALNELLWQYRPESFVPHSLDANAAEAVAIGDLAQPGSHSDLLINLGGAVTESFSRFHRMAEIVCQEDQWLQASRERYRWYQDRGYPLHRHEIRAEG